MISPAQQQLDEVLTAGGHSDQCPAFEGRRCPGYPVCGGNPVPDELYAAVGADRAAEARKQPRVVAEVSPMRHPERAAAAMLVAAEVTDPAITLVGPQARALVEYEAAAKELKAADEMHRQAVERFQRAHQAFADAMAARQG